MENPFDHPPTTPRVDLESTPSGGSGRGRLALVALASAGLLGTAIFGVSYLVSADDPELDPPVVAAAAIGDDESDESVPTEGETDDGPGVPEVSGEIVIDDGDGDPIVIDLDDLGDFEDGLPGLSECFDIVIGDSDGELGGVFEFDPEQMEEFVFDLDALFEEFPLDDMFGELPLEDWEHGTWGPSVTITGPDGTTIIDLGDGGSVTVTNDGGELSIETDGDATTADLEEMLGDFDVGTMLEEFPLDEMFGDFGEVFEDFGVVEPGLFEDCFSVEIEE